MRSKAETKVRRTHIPAGEGRAFEARQGEFMAVVDVKGKQVGDFWAIDANDFDHNFSPPHTIVRLGSLSLRVGDTLVTNRRLPILTVAADDVGRHDLLYPPCDPARYELDFGVKGHRSCKTNFQEAVAKTSWGTRLVPHPPLNVFMNTEVLEGGKLTAKEGLSKAGDRIIFRAERDILGVLSSCPMDLTAIGGGEITELLVLVSDDLEAVKREERKYSPVLGGDVGEPGKGPPGPRLPETKGKWEKCDASNGIHGSLSVFVNSNPAAVTASRQLTRTTTMRHAPHPRSPTQDKRTRVRVRLIGELPPWMV